MITFFALFFFMTTLLLFALTITMGFYLYRFIRIIMVFEDDLSETIESLIECETIIQNTLKMKVFFDSLEVKQEFQNALEQIKICRLKVLRTAERFIERSEQKYIIYEEEEQRQLENVDIVEDSQTYL